MNRQNKQALEGIAKMAGVTLAFLFLLFFYEFATAAGYGKIAVVGVLLLLLVALIVRVGSITDALIWWPLRIFEGLCVGIGVGLSLYLLMHDLGVHSDLTVSTSGDSGGVALLSAIIGGAYVGARWIGWIELPSRNRADSDDQDRP